MSQTRDLTEALHALTQIANGEKREGMKSRGVAPAAESAALLNVGKTSGTGGIASPLTEQSYAARTFHPDINLTSTDGLFVIKLKPVDKIIMTDANGELVEFKYLPPS